MTDATTNKPLRVVPDDRAGPYIRVPAVQLKDVERVLKDNGIRCWADENVISLNGAPAVGVINLGKNGDPARAQAALDSVP